MTVRTIGVVTIAAGRRRHLARQIDSIGRQSRPPDAYVVVDMGGPPIESHGPSPPTVVDAGHPAGPLELARSRNVGCREVGTELIVFLDADCVATPSLIADYAERLEAHPGIHAGPVGHLPAPVHDPCDEHALDTVAVYHDGRPSRVTPLHRSTRYDLFWSLSFAIDRRSWDRIGGFDERFVGYGGEDTDFGRSARASGVDLWFGASARAFHQYHPTRTPPTHHLVSICRNATVYHDKWGEWPMGGWLQSFVELGLITWSPEADTITIERSPVDTAPGVGMR